MADRDVSTLRRLVRRARRTATTTKRILRGGPGSDFPLNEAYAIDLWEGDDPLELGPAGPEPALQARDAQRDRTFYVADPFLVPHEDRWWLLYELVRWTDARGVIAAAVSDDLRVWEHRGVVLDTKSHLSYPHPVRDDDGTWWMVPESSAAGEVRAWRARVFPTEWEPGPVLLEGPHVDATPFRHGGRWWMFTCDRPRGHDRLRLYTAPALLGPWEEHPASPLVDGDPTAARPAGPVLALDDGLVRLAQVCEPIYGTAVRGFRIDVLEPDRYAETPLPGRVLEPGRAPWASGGMHHLSTHRFDDGRWVGAVDGWHRVQK